MLTAQEKKTRNLGWELYKVDQLNGMIKPTIKIRSCFNPYTQKDYLSKKKCKEIAMELGYKFEAFDPFTCTYDPTIDANPNLTERFKELGRNKRF